MLFKFSNLGIVKEAEIELNGLTILTGHNNIGKSFISRSIFSIIKTINQYEEQFIADRMEKIEDITRKLFFDLRRTHTLDNKYEYRFRELIENFFLQITNLVSSSSKPSLDLINKQGEKLIEYLSNNSLSEKISLRMKNNVDNLLLDIKRILSEEINKEQKLKNTFNQFVRNEFQNQLSYRKETSNIDCIDGELEIFKIIVENNITKSFIFNESLQFLDSTLVETPVFIHLARFIRNFALRQFSRAPNKRNLSRYADLAIHISDLIEKLTNEPLSSDSIIHGIDINKIIGGKVFYDSKEDNFYYEKDGTRIKPINMDSGVKSFGIIDILLNNGNLNSKSLLIIDEPEVHLHPEWQIEYSKIICALVENNIHVIISSHSPYFIKGIEVYKGKFEIEDKIKYYLGDYDGNRIIFSDITKNLEPVYEKLSIPMMKLSFES